MFMSAKDDELRVKKIREGTVIDHISAGHSLTVLRMLGFSGKETNVISILMNVPSKKLGMKDILKIESRELNPSEVDKIALIAPHATINIIRDYNVVKKKNVKLPKVIRGPIECSNPTCISNAKEPIKSTFMVVSEDPLCLRCHYCSRLIEKEDILRQF